MGKGIEKCYICKSVRGNGLSLHAFPKDEYLHSLWIKKLKINDTQLLCKSTKICSKHFSSSEFISSSSSSSNSKNILYHNAVPSLNPRNVELLMSAPSSATVKRNCERKKRNQFRKHNKFATLSQIECNIDLEDIENVNCEIHLEDNENINCEIRLADIENINCEIHSEDNENINCEYLVEEIETPIDINEQYLL